MPETEEEKEKEKMGFQLNGFNQFRSDRIALNREIPDTRDPRYETSEWEKSSVSLIQR